MHNPAKGEILRLQSLTALSLRMTMWRSGSHYGDCFPRGFLSRAYRLWKQIASATKVNNHQYITPPGLYPFDYGCRKTSTLRSGWESTSETFLEDTLPTVVTLSEEIYLRVERVWPIFNLVFANEIINTWPRHSLNNSLINSVQSLSAMEAKCFRYKIPYS